MKKYRVEKNVSIEQGKQKPLDGWKMFKVCFAIKTVQTPRNLARSVYLEYSPKYSMFLCTATYTRNTLTHTQRRAIKMGIKSLAVCRAGLLIMCSSCSVVTNENVSSSVKVQVDSGRLLGMGR